MRCLLLLQILIIVIIIIVAQAILFYTLSCKLVYSNSNFDRKYILKLINSKNNFNLRIFKMLRMSRLIFLVLILSSSKRISLIRLVASSISDVFY